MKKHQQLGTKGFATQGFDAQALQNQRVSQETPSSLIGASPGQQASARSNSAQALDPTIQGARSSQQTFGEQINSLGDALDRAKSFLDSQVAQQDKERDDARALLKDAISSFGGDAFDILDKKYIKLAGYDEKTVAMAKQTLKERELELKIEKANAAKTTTSPASSALSGVLETTSTLLNSPYIKDITGLVQLGAIPGSPAQPTLAAYEQLKGILALSNRSQLKGSGAISDFESKTLERASSALNRSLSASDFSKQVSRVQGAFRTASGLTASVKVTNNDTGESKYGDLTREEIDSALLQGYTVEYQ